MSEKPDFVKILAEEYINTGEMPVPQVFRAENAEHLDEIKRLQTLQILQTDSSGRYRVPVYHFRRASVWPKERRVTNKIGLKLRELHLADPMRPEFPVDLVRPQDEPGIDDRNLKRAFHYLGELGFLRYTPTVNAEGKFTTVGPSDSILEFKDIEAEMEKQEKVARAYRKTLNSNTLAGFLNPPRQPSPPPIPPSDVAALWLEIKDTYSMSKPRFGKRIAFITDLAARDLIFRDVAHAHGCLKSGFYKAAVVLAGGVIEHLLHQYLQHKGHPIKSDNFSEILKECEKSGMVGSPILHLSSALRDFRNLVHLKREIADTGLISKTTATGAVNSIFTISGAFKP